MRFKIIYFENYAPKPSMKEGVFNQKDADILNGIVEEVMAALQEDEDEEDVLVPWSSHVHLQSMVMGLCKAGVMKGMGGRGNNTNNVEKRNNNININTDQDKDIDKEKLWRCNDHIHSGRVLYEHYSRMLLDYLCSEGG